MLSVSMPLIVKDVMGGSEQQMGLVISLWTIGVVVFRLFSGQWVDRFGIKKLVVLSILLFLIATFMYYGASELMILLVIRVIHGGSFAVAATSMSALAAEMVPHSRKGEGIGYFSMFMSVSMVVGPALGVYIIDMGNPSSLYTIGAVISSIALVSTVLVKEPRPKLVTSKVKCTWTWRHLIEKEAIPISLVGFFLSFAYSSLTSFIPSFARELQQAHATALFFVVFAITIILSRPFTGRVFDQHGAQWIIYPGVLMFVAGMTLLSQLDTMMLLLLAAALMGIGYGALFPCFQTLAVRSVPRERRGIATSTFFLLFDLGFGVGSFVLGWIANAADYRMMFFTAGLAVLIGPSIYYVHQKRNQTCNVPKNEANGKGV